MASFASAWLLAILVIVVGLCARPAVAGSDDNRLCGETGLCAVSIATPDGPVRRTYRVRAPDGWNGETPLPVLIHFHGAGRSSAFVLSIERLTRPASDAGFLFVSLDSLGKTWNFRTKNGPDVAAADAVVADLARRAPIRRDRIFFSGFSHGGAMTWRLACDRGAAYAGYISIAGAISGFDPGMCESGPARMIQVHGRRDRAIPPPLRDKSTPDDDFLSWREANHCAPAPDQQQTVGRFHCRHWTRCAAGGSASLCLTNAQHENPKQWLGFALTQLQREIMTDDAQTLAHAHLGAHVGARQVAPSQRNAPAAYRDRFRD